MYDYFYGEQSEQFSFYRIPKVLFTGEAFKDLSVESRVLYGILLDRMSLSAKNGWMDEEGRVYIIFTTDEVMKAMNCADNKATKLMAELENKAGLIVRCRQGLGKPSRIFVKNFISSEEGTETALQEAPSESRFKNRENHDSGIAETTIQEPPKSRTNNTDIKETDISDTDLFPSGTKGKEGIKSEKRSGPRKSAEEALKERAVKEKFLKAALEYDILLCDYPAEKETLSGILELMLDVLCTTRPYIHVAGEDKPAEVVKSRFMKMNSDHIRYVLRCMKENTTEIRNMKQYLLTTLYNSPITMDPYYRALVNNNAVKALYAGS